MSYFRKIMELFLFLINYNDDDANVFLLDVQALQWLLFYYLWVVTYGQTWLVCGFLAQVVKQPLPHQPVCKG